MSSFEPGSERRVLQNVPPVGFFGTWREHPLAPPAPEDHPFPACLASCLRYLGDGLGQWEFYCPLPKIHPHYPGGHGKVDLTYAFLMGVSGAAFRLSWKPGWHRDNVATWLLGNDPAELFHRTFAASGRKLTLLSRRHGGSAESDMLRAVIESIDRGIPVIAHGVIGPPEECVVTGYDDGGNTLIGYNFFQNSPEFQQSVAFEPDGQFRRRDWLQDTESLILIGDKVDRSPMPQILREALRWAHDVMTSPKRMDRINGIEAFAACRRSLLQDEEFRGKSREELRLRRDALADLSGVIAEGRWYAHVFCRWATTQLPEAGEDLLRAAGCFDAEHTLMWQLWSIWGGPGRNDEQLDRIADRDVRRQTDEILAEAGKLDARAAAHIARAVGLPADR